MGGVLSENTVQPGTVGGIVFPDEFAGLHKPVATGVAYGICGELCYCVHDYEQRHSCGS